MVASALREAASASLAALAGSGAAAAATGSPTAAPQRNVWALQGCCNTDQWVLVGLIAAYSVLIMLLWRTPVLTPLKMIGTCRAAAPPPSLPPSLTRACSPKSCSFTSWATLLAHGCRAAAFSRWRSIRTKAA